MLFELPIFEHIDAQSAEEAVSWLKKYGAKARVIAGGTDLLSLMKDHLAGPELQIPEVLINIKTIPELTQIVYDEKAGLKIGSCVTLRRLAESDIIKQRFGLLSQAGFQVGTTQLRTMGTIGGNLCQRPQCLYFRQPEFSCFKKGGTKCFAASGEHRHYYSILQSGRCVMAHPSDTAPALIALKAKAVIAGSKGEKKTDLEAFFLGANNYLENILKADEFITHIEVPLPKEGTRQIFIKQKIRHSADFALASVAASAQMSGNICKDMRIVLGGVAPLPYVVSSAVEILKEKEASEKLISAAAEASVKEARPLPMNQYKVELSKVLVKRALAAVCLPNKKG